MVRFFRVNKDISLPISNTDISTTIKWSFFITKQTDDALTNVRRYLLRRATHIYSWLNQNIIRCVRISCSAASSLYAISHAIERESTVSKSKTVPRPLGHINFTLRKSSKNIGINTKKLEVVFKYSIAYKKHVIIVALWPVVFCNNFYTLLVTLFNLNNVEMLRHI